MHQTDDREQPCLESRSSEKATASALTCQNPAGCALQEVSAAGALARQELISLGALTTLVFFLEGGEERSVFFTLHCLHFFQDVVIFPLSITSAGGLSLPGDPWFSTQM